MTSFSDILPDLRLEVLNRLPYPVLTRLRTSSAKINNEAEVALRARSTLDCDRPPMSESATVSLIHMLTSRIQRHVNWLILPETMKKSENVDFVSFKKELLYYFPNLHSLPSSLDFTSHEVAVYARERHSLRTFESSDRKQSVETFIGIIEELPNLEDLSIPSRQPRSRICEALTRLSLAGRLKKLALLRINLSTASDPLIESLKTLALTVPDLTFSIVINLDTLEPAQTLRLVPLLKKLNIVMLQLDLKVFKTTTQQSVQALAPFTTRFSIEADLYCEPFGFETCEWPNLQVIRYTNDVHPSCPLMQSLANATLPVLNTFSYFVSMDENETAVLLFLGKNRTNLKELSLIIQSEDVFSLDSSSSVSGLDDSSKYRFSQDSLEFPLPELDLTTPVSARNIMHKVARSCKWLERFSLLHDKTEYSIAASLMILLNAQLGSIRMEAYLREGLLPNALPIQLLPVVLGLSRRSMVLNVSFFSLNSISDSELETMVQLLYQQPVLYEFEYKIFQQDGEVICGHLRNQIHTVSRNQKPFTFGTSYFKGQPFVEYLQPRYKLASDIVNKLLPDTTAVFSSEIVEAATFLEESRRSKGEQFRSYLTELDELSGFEVLRFDDSIDEQSRL